jgi:hypothetical protein
LLALAKTSGNGYHALVLIGSEPRITSSRAKRAALARMERQILEVSGSAMIDDTSLEFDMFEDIRRKLVEVFVREGRTRIEAEKIALYVVQGVRDVPKLLTILTEEEVDAEILHALHSFLDDASALDKAREMLIGLDQPDQG